MRLLFTLQYNASYIAAILSIIRFGDKSIVNDKLRNGNKVSYQRLTCRHFICYRLTKSSASERTVSESSWTFPSQTIIKGFPSKS